MTTNYFQSKHRNGQDGDVYVTLREDAPEWVRDAVREAHDGEYPDDWRYATCEAIFQCIDDGVTEASEIADSLVDIYMSDLVQWLADRLDRATYVDGWHEDTGSDREDLITQIRYGQYYCIEQMAQIILAAVEQNREES